MENQQFRAWSYNAAHKILFPPDRLLVQQELYDHMEDHFEALVDSGLPREAAEQRTLEAMGNAFELAPQLAAVHKPFWGYFHRFSRVVLVLALLICLWPIGEYLYEIYQPLYLIFDPSDPDIGQELISAREQDSSFRGDSAVYTLTGSSLWNQETGNGTSRVLAFQIEQVNTQPWGFEDNYYSHLSYAPISWLWAEDDQGNYYYSYAEMAPDTNPGELCLRTHGSQTGLFTYTHEFWIHDFPEGVQWLKLHFDRDGRDYVLILDLTGGDGT